MVIKILGTGCPSCQKLERNTREAVCQMKLEAEVVKVTDLEKMMSYGLMSFPGLVVDEKLVSYGSIPSVEDIKKLLAQ